MKKASLTLLFLGTIFLSLAFASELDASVAEAERQTPLGNNKDSGKSVAAKKSAPAKKAGKKGKKSNIGYKTVTVESALPWREIEFSSVAPSKRQGHSLTLAKDKLYVFGGCFLDEICYNDMRIYDTVKDEWKELSKTDSGVIPSPRGRHSASLVGDTRIVFFGGSANEMYRNDVFVFDTKAETFLKPAVTGKPPSPRSGHGAAVWKTRVFIFGGYTPDGYVSDLYVLDTSLMAWAQPPVSGTWPSPRSGHSFTRIAQTEMSMPLPDAKPKDDKKDKKGKKDDKKSKKDDKKKGKKGKSEPKKKLVQTERMVLFGGASDSGVLNDVFVFDAALMAWAKPAIRGLAPVPRHDHVASAYKNYLFINGGCDIRNLACYNDTIVLDCDKLEWGLPTYDVKVKQSYVKGSADDDDLIAMMKRKEAQSGVTNELPKDKKTDKKDDKKDEKKDDKKDDKKPRFVEEDDEDEEDEEDDEEWERHHHHHHHDQVGHPSHDLLASQGADNAHRFVEDEDEDDEYDDDEDDEYDDEEEDEYDEEEDEDELDERNEMEHRATTEAASTSSTSLEVGKDKKKDKKDNKNKDTKNKDKRIKRRRHTDKSKSPKGEDLVKELTARGGHAATFVKEKLYMFGGCFLEQKCNFDFLYLHVPAKVKVGEQQQPVYETGQVITSLPKSAVIKKPSSKKPAKPKNAKNNNKKDSKKYPPTMTASEKGSNAAFAFRQQGLDKELDHNREHADEDEDEFEDSDKEARTEGVADDENHASLLEHITSTNQQNNANHRTKGSGSHINSNNHVNTNRNSNSNSHRVVITQFTKDGNEAEGASATKGRHRHKEKLRIEGQATLQIEPFETKEEEKSAGISGVYHSKLFLPITIVVLGVCIGGVCIFAFRSWTKEAEKDERKHNSLTGFLTDKSAREALEKDLEKQQPHHDEEMAATKRREEAQALSIRSALEPAPRPTNQGPLSFNYEPQQNTEDPETDRRLME